MVWFFSHFGFTMLILFVDFVLFFGSSLFNWENWDFESACCVGFIINAFALSIALSFLILGE